MRPRRRQLCGTWQRTPVITTDSVRRRRRQLFCGVIRKQGSFRIKQSESIVQPGLRTAPARRDRRQWPKQHSAGLPRPEMGIGRWHLPEDRGGRCFFPVSCECCSRSWHSSCLVHLRGQSRRTELCLTLGKLLGLSKGSISSDQFGPLQSNELYWEDALRCDVLTRATKMPTAHHTGTLAFPYRFYQ